MWLIACDSKISYDILTWFMRWRWAKKSSAKNSLYIKAIKAELLKRRAATTYLTQLKIVKVARADVIHEELEIATEDTEEDYAFDA